MHTDASMHMHVHAHTAGASLAQCRALRDCCGERICLCERHRLVERVEVRRVERGDEVAHEVEAEAVRDRLALQWLQHYIRECNAIWLHKPLSAVRSGLRCCNITFQQECERLYACSIGAAGDRAGL